MKLKINSGIAFTHLLARKKQTLVASMGVTIGIALYIFSNSIVVGVSSYSKQNMFKTIPHLRIYKEDELSHSIKKKENGTLFLITNPSFTSSDKSIINPYALMNELEKFSFVETTAPQINVDLFYQNGNSRLKGIGSGISVLEADSMFNIRSTMEAGDLGSLTTDLNGIIIGKGVAEKLQLRLNDYVTVVSSLGIIKVMRVNGIFGTDNKGTDESKSYMHIATAQQLSRVNPSSVTDIYVKLSNPDSSAVYARQIREITDYSVEDWQVAHADQLAQSRMIGTMSPMIALSIMLVAAFGIYNIINMTISQKLNDIAILKATGFRGKDIIQIFLTEASIMGVLGTILGVMIGTFLVKLAMGIYVGPPIGYFPIEFKGSIIVSGMVFGILTSLGAGFLPARKASRVDPVSIFRK